MKPLYSTLDDYISKKATKKLASIELQNAIISIFNENLKTAKEDFPQVDFREHLNIATQWTTEKLSQFVTGIAEGYYWQRQDDVNKHMGL